MLVDGNDLYAGTFDGVFRSTNGGTLWKATNLGLPGSPVNALAANGMHLYAGTMGDGVYRSTDHGSTWFAANAQISDVMVEAMCAHDSIVLVATASAIFRSTDSGTTWVEADAGLQSYYGLAFALQGPNIFLGTAKTIALSTNSGKTWKVIDDGLDASWIHAIAISGSSIYAGTGRAGVWRRSMAEIIDAVAALDSSLPVRIELHQNFPNPFNPSTTIRYGLPERSHVSLAVYNMLGQAVTQLVNGEVDAGYHEVKFDGSYLPSGVYFYRLQAGRYVETRKLCLVR
jgi:photosystem II stability/assembly factor-like uncharacterized protein